MTEYIEVISEFQESVTSELEISPEIRPVPFVIERDERSRVLVDAGNLAIDLCGIESPTTTSPEIIDKIADLEKFVDIPNRREALVARNQDNMEIYITFAIARKLYRCPECHGDIDIGIGHGIVKYVQPVKRSHDHHHWHSECIHDKLLPTLSNIEIINPKNASPSVVNEKARRLRYKTKRR